MFCELVFPDTVRHAWLAGLPMYRGRSSYFLSVWNSEAVWCNYCVTLSLQPAILAVKSVTLRIYTGLHTVDFHILLKLVINRDLF